MNYPIQKTIRNSYRSNIPKAICIILFIFFYSCTSSSQRADREEINKDLKRELLDIFELDQRYRTYLSRINSSTSLRDSLSNAYDVDSDQLRSALWARQLSADSTNLIRIEDIIATYGYPGISMVGEEASTAAWYVIQHNGLQAMETYFPLIKKAADNGELKKPLMATMHDRMLMNQGKPQLYGTQGYGFRTSDGGFQTFIWPIKEDEEVNTRRKKLGFSNTVEESAKSMGIEYKPYTIEVLKKMSDSIPYFK